MARDTASQLAASGVYGGFPSSKLATILNGASVSEILDLGPMRLGGIIFPAAWTAAGLGLLVGIDGVNVFTLRDATGTEYAVTVNVGDAQLLTIADFLTFNTVQLRSGTKAAPVNQGGDRAFTLLLVS